MAGTYGRTRRRRPQPATAAAGMRPGAGASGRGTRSTRASATFGHGGRSAVRGQRRGFEGERGAGAAHREEVDDELERSRGRPEMLIDDRKHAVANGEDGRDPSVRCSRA